MPSTAFICVIDDDQSVRTALDGLLRSHGYRVKSYVDAVGFLSSGEFETIACLISDIQMPGMTGLQLHEQLCARGIHLPTIFITGHQGMQPRVNASATAPVAFFPKPFHCGELLRCIESMSRHTH